MTDTTSKKRRLVIVESPAKAKTIAGYLGEGFVVESSIGHIRDLPTKAAEVPAEIKKESWGRLGVDVDTDFRAYYVVDPDKKKKIAELKRELKDADELLLATDEDREGEAIAWHLFEELKPKVPVRRMVFHEITRDAIRRALDETRDIDQRLVDAQETRRILDRLYGYEVSPVLWKKVMPRLSAGRVQSVATRLVVERERERMRFVSAGYWDLLGSFLPGPFEARLVAVDGKRIAQGRDFGDDGSRAERCSRARRGGRPRSGRAVRRRVVRGALGGGEAVHPPPGGAVPDVDAAAGGEPQAALLGADDDARRPAAVRARLHHVHAHRLDDVVRVGADRSASSGSRALRGRHRPRRSRGSTRGRSRTRRRHTKRCARPVTGSGCRRMSLASSIATSRRCTT